MGTPWAFALAGCLVTATASPAEAAAPLVLTNGTIYTLNPDMPYASALCVRAGRLEAVGTASKVLSSSCASQTGTDVVDLHGATVVPGLTDSHAHLMMEAARRTRADLSAAHSSTEAVQAAVSFARQHPDLVNASGGWVLGFGWDQTKWPGGAFPTREDLDASFPNQPVFLDQLSGHACWINSKALELAAADLPATGDPPGGHIERDASGRPTGILSDGARDIVAKHVPPVPEKQADAVLSELLRDCAAHGLTGVHDLMAEPDDVALFQRRHSQGRLGLRVYAVRDGHTSSPSDPQVHTEDGLLTVRAVKFFADGALGSWSAAMLRPYNDRPNTTGTLCYKGEELQGNISAWAAHGYQVAIHAIGDHANRQVLDTYAQLLPAAGADPRWRVEHAQILAPEDIPRFAQLGVLPSMQPSHCASDLPYAEQRLGHDRAKGGYAWMSLLKTGIPALPFGSDFPTAGSVPPLLGFHAAVTRQTADGQPQGGWFPAQRVTTLQALKGYTVDSAYASFREKELGVIAQGYHADLTVFDTDILTVDSSYILNATVLLTLVGGQVTHSSSSLPALQARTVARGTTMDASPSNSQLAAARLQRWWTKYVKEVQEDRWMGVGPLPRQAESVHIVV